MIGDAGLVFIVLSVLLMTVVPAERLLRWCGNHESPGAVPLARAFQFPDPEPTLDELVVRAEAALASAAKHPRANGAVPHHH